MYFLNFVLSFESPHRRGGGGQRGSGGGEQRGSGGGRQRGIGGGGGQRRSGGGGQRGSGGRGPEGEVILICSNITNSYKTRKCINTHAERERYNIIYFCFCFNIYP